MSYNRRAREAGRRNRVAKRSGRAFGGHLKKLVARHGTPLLAVSRSVLRAQIARFRRALPRVEPFYAIKANPHPEILKTVVAAGTGFDGTRFLFAIDGRLCGIDADGGFFQLVEGGETSAAWVELR